ncbi:MULTISPECIES: histidine phosphatase family protein [unclassified Amycolatopsis]|uniref:histidine phosphatase family protein n=1 Tax=unclassified Amycolatopsis TaxID=2618356 RepID=UPI00287602DF|nr:MULTISPECIES: histidine phosphatase family protein [unclassified Amycolatopsis]MDS0132898.1 histidine phosphatase family protein [Amycolatopsis sp. 505]MDS0142277.1 histidine phosphatase family protein [Amycolatopsis sp. CM201R]
MRLLLIRHGQTDGNVRGALDTALPGPPLTDLGRRQADALAARLAEEPLVAVYASQATRAQQTAAPLAARFSLDVQVVDGVHEVVAGDLEGATDHASIRTYMETVRRWTLGELAPSLPGGESGTSVRTRMLDAVGRLRAKHEQADPDGVIALVSHGGAIRLTGEWLAPNVHADVANAALIPNTGLVELVAQPEGQWRCLTWVDTPL